MTLALFLAGLFVVFIVPVFVATAIGHAKGYGMGPTFAGLIFGWIGVLVVAVMPYHPSAFQPVRGRRRRRRTMNGGASNVR